jgi:hypothetical protein
MLDDTRDPTRSGAEHRRIGVSKVGVETSLTCMLVWSDCMGSCRGRTYPNRPFHGRGRYSEFTGGGRARASLSSTSSPSSPSIPSASGSPVTPASSAGAALPKTPFVDGILLSPPSVFTCAAPAFFLLALPAAGAAEVAPAPSMLSVPFDGTTLTSVVAFCEVEGLAGAALTPFTVLLASMSCWCKWTSPSAHSCPSGEARRALGASSTSGLMSGFVVAAPPRDDCRRGSCLPFAAGFGGRGTSERRIFERSTGASPDAGDAAAVEALRFGGMTVR